MLRVMSARFVERDLHMTMFVLGTARSAVRR